MRDTTSQTRSKRVSNFSNDSLLLLHHTSANSWQWDLHSSAVGIPSTGSGNLYCQWELSPGSGNALCILFPTTRMLQICLQRHLMHKLTIDGFKLMLLYALMVNPIVYTSCIEQFWATVKVKTVVGEVQLQALVDGKKVIIIESTVRRDLQLEDAEGVDCLPSAAIFEQLTLMWIYVTPSYTKKIFRNMRRVGKGFSKRETPLFPTMMKQRPRKTKRKDTELPQTSGPITNVADEAMNEEMNENLVMAATTASS
nr:hypothetical protein [Tanacetum cinerariifolium]